MTRAVRAARRVAWTACAIAGLVALAGAQRASAEPSVAALDACAFPGTQFTVDGTGFLPGQALTAEVMRTADPLAGAALTAREVTVGADGRIEAALDAPAAEGLLPTVRSVRIRDRSPGMPTLLASTLIASAGRGVSVLPRAADGKARGRERWRLVGLPDDVALWAHYRHGGKTVASVAVGTTDAACGVASFTLRTLPRGHERAGAWTVWITAAEHFETPRGVYVQRRMAVTGDGARAHVAFGPVKSRLQPRDPRVNAPTTKPLAIASSRVGLLSLSVYGAGEAPVEFFERTGEQLTPLGSARAAAGAPAVLDNATTWTCARSTRRFTATAALPGGSALSATGGYRTPSCASRFSIAVPARVTPGAVIAVRVDDRWAIGGVSPALCTTAPSGRGSCEPLVFAPGVTSATRRLRTGRRGTWRIDLRIAGTHTRASVGVGERGARAGTLPTVLATGDSLMAGVDSFLGDELAGAAVVRSDVRPGSGISKPDAGLPASDWVSLAAEQAATVRPDSTVIMVGANDGLAMAPPAGTTVDCCAEPWIAEYARRVRVIVRSYLQEGRGRVYWLTVPLPRAPARAAITAAVNRAIRRGTHGVAGVTIVPLDVFFTPNGFADTYAYRGRDVAIRALDGIHLNPRGQAIAAEFAASLVRGGP